MKDSVTNGIANVAEKLQLVPPVFARSPISVGDAQRQGNSETVRKLSLDSPLPYHLVYPLLPSFEKERPQLLKRFLRDFNQLDGIGLILLNLLEPEQASQLGDWLELEGFSGPDVPDLHLLQLSDYEPDEMLEFLLAKADSLLLPRLDIETLASPWILSLISHYKPVILPGQDFDPALQGMKLQPQNILWAFPFFRILSHKIPQLTVLQLNHRFIEIWNQQKAAIAAQLIAKSGDH